MIPVDINRCQGEILEGSFMTLRPRRFERCSNKPAYIAVESEPGADGNIGRMSVCEACKPELEKQRQDVLYLAIVPGPQI